MITDSLAFSSLLQHLNKHSRISMEDFEFCKQYFKIEHFNAHTLVINTGSIVTKQYYVVKGCLRTYLPDDERDREYTVQFAVEEWWASDFIAYYSGASALLNVECLENSTLLSIQKNDLAQLYVRVPALESFFLRKLENAFVAFQRRILSNLKDTAEDRYDGFLKQYPGLDQRVKNYQIASYLGITPESLSRIRKHKAKQV